MTPKEYVAKTSIHLIVGDWSRIAARAEVTTQTAARIKKIEKLCDMTAGERRAFDAYVYYVKLRQAEEAKLTSAAKDATPNITEP